MVNLLIDIGNTAVKAACFRDRSVMKAGRAAWAENDELEELLLKMLSFGPSRAFLGNVSKKKETIENILQAASVPYTYFLPETPVPIKNRYETPETLGRDRLANAVAANLIYPGLPVVIIDAGTCIKFDFITGKNEYFGGSIAPGIDMRFAALHKFTARIPLIERDETVYLIGKNTREAVQSGVINGALAEVKGILEQYQMTHKDLKVIITGGDHALLERSLKTSVLSDPWLTLKGLNEILLYHAG